MRPLLLRVLAGAALLVAMPGCDDPDPFTADLRMICGAAARHQDLPPEMRTLAAMRDIAERIKTPEAARLMAELMQAAPGERAALLAPPLRRAKLSSCPTLER
jgi:hypothetical protein